MQGTLQKNKRLRLFPVEVAAHFHLLKSHFEQALCQHNKPNRRGSPYYGKKANWKTEIDTIRNMVANQTVNGAVVSHLCIFLVKNWLSYQENL